MLALFRDYILLFTYQKNVSDTYVDKCLFLYLYIFLFIQKKKKQLSGCIDHATDAFAISQDCLEFLNNLLRNNASNQVCQLSCCICWCFFPSLTIACL